MDYAIDVQNVSMVFNLEREIIESLKEYFIKLLKGQLHYDAFYALKNISFTLKHGESLALIGDNGSGKSTLLKIIAQIFKPTLGTVLVNGTIAPMIELGAGFDSELTAKENVFLNGAFLGLSQNYLHDKYDEIIDFSELKEFEDVPIKNFSSGMRARLAFAISTTVKPDILIVDEILSVGDIKFKEKSSKRMNELLSDGTTLILVSHSLEQVKNLCTKAIWLQKGEMVKKGDAFLICDEYLQNNK